MSFQECIRLVEQFAAPAGLVRIDPFPTAATLPKLTDSASFWRSSWAQLLLMELPKGSVDDLKAAANLGQEWLDVSCSIQEKDNLGVVDGYLGLFSSRRLDSDAESVGRQLELNTQTCRKHIIWPEDTDDLQLRWRRLLRITALGLPQSPASEGMTQSPKLTSSFQIAVLEDIRMLSGKRAAKYHAEDPSKAPTE